MNIVTDSGHSGPLKNRIVSLSSSQRLTRSLKGAGFYFGLALASVFVPVFHFVLVPLFLVLTLAVAFSRYKKTSFLDLRGVNCPACQHPLKETEMYFKENPSRLYCYECRNQLRISQL